jgi:hypothetical protein
MQTFKAMIVNFGIEKMCKLKDMKFNYRDSGTAR